jgi:hypothetical protein
MDFTALQHKLFALDPSDRAEDLRKLKESAGATDNVAPTKDYVVESVNVAQGSMPVEGDYSLADFAALAGVTLTESQKTGSAGQLKAKDVIKKQPAGTTKNPTRDKLVGEDFKDDFKTGREKYNSLELLKSKSPENKPNTPTASTSKSKAAPAARAGDWRGFLKQHTATLQKISADPKKKAAFDKFMAKMDESVEEAEVMKFKAPNTVKQRDPNWRDMDALRKSGAMGAHKDKKRDDKMGKTKHKKDYAAESIKEMLYRKLNQLK